MPSAKQIATQPTPYSALHTRHRCHIWKNLFDTVPNKDNYNYEINDYTKVKPVVEPSELFWFLAPVAYIVHNPTLTQLITKTQVMHEKLDKKTLNQPKAPSATIKTVLAINLLLLSGFMIWEITAPLRKSDLEKQEETEMQRVAIETALNNNKAPKDLSGTLGETVTHTINATGVNTWVHFSFKTGAIIESESMLRESLKWDMAFRRAKILTNGGATNKNGKGAVGIVFSEDLDSVTEVPSDIEFVSDAVDDNPMEPKNPAIDKWYEYDLWMHELKPKNIVYIIRTADGHYAKMKMKKYYCGTAPACYTFTYRYQGKESRSFVN